MQTPSELNNEGRRLWDQKAAFWDELHGDEGNLFHRVLVSPSVEHLAQLQSGERVLDIACGNGVMTRRLAALGGRVTATDFSAELIRYARLRTHDGLPIDYHVMDATDESALCALGEGTFNLIVSTMALMDIPVLAPLFRAVRRLLAPRGRFVFATMHPSFNSNNPIFTLEQIDVGGVVEVKPSLKLLYYDNMPPALSSGAPNEPNPHYYFHRPLHQLLAEAFVAGLVLDGLEEPCFREEHVRPERLLSWTTLTQFPPILTGRFRIAG